MKNVFKKTGKISWCESVKFYLGKIKKEEKKQYLYRLLQYSLYEEMIDEIWV